MGLVLKLRPSQNRDMYSEVWQTLQTSGPPQKPPAHWHNNVSPD